MKMLDGLMKRNFMVEIKNCYVLNAYWRLPHNLHLYSPTPIASWIWNEVSHALQPPLPIAIDLSSLHIKPQSQLPQQIPKQHDDHKDLNGQGRCRCKITIL